MSVQEEILIIIHLFGIQFVQKIKADKLLILLDEDLQIGHKSYCDQLKKDCWLVL